MIVCNFDNIRKKKGREEEKEGREEERKKRKNMSAEEAIDLVLRGHHVFLTGIAGAGKSFTLHQLKQRMNKKRIKYAFTGSTGRAAIPHHGCTIHSFAGSGIGDQPESFYITKMQKSKFFQTRWKSIKVLVIEEISMISDKFFELINVMAQTARKSKKLFGGLQLVVCGDFKQLSPVHGEFVFHSETFQKLFPSSRTVYLRKVYRQTDPVFLRVLKECRDGEPSEATIDILRQRIIPVPKEWPVDPVVLVPRCAQALEHNQAKLAEIPGESKIYEYTFHASPRQSKKGNQIIMENLLKHGPFLPKLELKVGAQVMHTVNNRLTGKINGSLGVVTGFQHSDPVIKFTDGTEHTVEKHTFKGPKEQGKIVQYPLLHAWALTIHKSQGSTIPYLELDLGPNSNQYGQAYVGMSRAKSLDGLVIKPNFDPRSIRANPEAKAYYDTLMAEKKKKSKKKKRKFIQTRIESKKITKVHD